MKLSIVFFALIFSLSAQAMSAPNVISCQTFSSGSTIISDEGTEYLVSLEAPYDNANHRLADKLSLPQSPILGQGHFRIPKSDCVLEQGRGQMTCSTENVTAVFIGYDNSVVTKVMDKLTLLLGVIGAGMQSTQVIYYHVVYGGRQVSLEESYGASVGSVGRMLLCGNPIGRN